LMVYSIVATTVMELIAVSQLMIMLIEQQSIIVKFEITKKSIVTMLFLVEISLNQVLPG
jgi:hypothetical protein